MAYLIYSEFKDISNSDITEDKFNELILKASDILDHVTNNFYQYQSIEDDKFLWRVKQFKKALASQITFFEEVGSTSYEGINNTPQSFSAGRTSVSHASRFNAGGKNESKSLIAEEVYMHLSGTGLLYRGV